jgi:hypothetical protein
MSAQPKSQRGTPVQILWCARCHTAFTFTGARVEHAAGGKPGIRHEYGALNELAQDRKI